MKNKSFIVLIVIMIVSPTILAYQASTFGDGKYSYTISIKNSHFEGSSIEVGLGDKIEWVNEDSYSYDFELVHDYGDSVKLIIMNISLAPGGKVDYIFDSEGITRAFGYESITNVKYCINDKCEGIINLEIETFKQLEEIRKNANESKTKIVSIQEGKFNPLSVEVEIGDTVEWVNEDFDTRYNFQLIEWYGSGSGVLAGQFLNPGQSIKYTFDKDIGEIDSLSYYCQSLDGLKQECDSQGMIIMKNTKAKFTSPQSVSSPADEVKVSTPTINEPLTVIEEQTLSSPSKNRVYFFIGLVVLIIFAIGGYGLKFIKNKPKAKQKKEVKEVEVEESKPEISEDIKEVISVSNFTLKYGQKIILENVNFGINKGEMVCLLGPSGTGKSTIIEALVGRKTPTKGTLKMLGKDISKDKDIFDYVGFVPQHSELYMNQTVEQNLLSSATKWGIKNAKEKAEKILSKIDLSHRKDLKASKLSGGQQKLLSLGMELIRDIEVCILDEPTTGLDPTTRNNIITILSHISSQFHKTILFTTHFMDDAEECDNVIILADKKIVAQGPPQKLEKMLPGGGKVVSIVLDNVTEDLLEKIEKINGVKKIIREGRTLKIISNEPNTVRMGHKIDEIGGSVNEAKMDRATMMEVFVYHTGKKPE